MIIAGIKLAFLGMSVVFLFLLLLVASIAIACRLLSGGSNKELEQMNAVDTKRKRRSQQQMDTGRLIAIVSGAIAAHRSGLRQTR